MRRHSNVNWILSENVQTWDQVNAAILMDIREELRNLNTLLRCPNFIRIPNKLDKIVVNTQKPKRKRK